jgi:hypothetical protein
MYDFSALYNIIPRDKLKSRLLDIIDKCFFNKNGKKEYSIHITRNTTLLNITLIPRTSTSKLKLRRCSNSS